MKRQRQRQHTHTHLHTVVVVCAPENEKKLSIDSAACTFIHAFTGAKIEVCKLMLD